nr:DEAD/DEAH box helicase family protein [Dietzia sp. SLG310A2-38A2]
MERDTCRELVVPALKTSGWNSKQIRSEYPISQVPDITGGEVTLLPRRRVDYVLEVAPGQPVAVVEAKRSFRSARDGLQQAIEYARRLDVPLAIATNGAEIVIHDRTSGTERVSGAFPTPAEAWWTYCTFAGLDQSAAELLLQPLNRRKTSTDGTVIEPRFYQTRAINAVLGAIARGETRILLLMATGTGKTFTAMQIVAKLLSYQERVAPQVNYRVLYLADRDGLLKQPMNKDFGPALGHELLQRVTVRADQSREIYFASYQALHGQKDGAELLHQFPTNFFDLVIVDECHRGSASENSLWRGSLDYFSSAIQLGLTATPRSDTVHSYEYFGDPVFTYSLREGIEDGYLAPYRIRRVNLSADADGWTPDPGELDRYGREIPAGTYTTRDFERTLSLVPRSRAMAHHLSGILRQNPAHKAMVFCVDVAHADAVRSALVAENPDLLREDPRWVVRIVGVENEKEALLEDFCDTPSPVVATTSRLLSTGTDVPDLRYVVLFRPVGSMIEFKQIIGRGTRLFPEAGKTSFEIIDYVGASEHFRDPGFDGYPAGIRVETIDGGGTVIDASTAEDDDEEDPTLGEPTPDFTPGDPDPADPFPGDDTDEHDHGSERIRYVVDNAVVTVVGEATMVMDRSTGEPRMVEVRHVVEGTLSDFGSPVDLAAMWADPAHRQEILTALAVRNIDLSPMTILAEETGTDLLDILLSMAFRTPVRTRAERARRAREAHALDIEAQSTAGRAVLEGLLKRYEEYGINDVTMQALQLRPISDAGSVTELADNMGGPDALRKAVDEIPRWLYGA